MALAVLKRPAGKVATERASKAQKKPKQAQFFWVPTTSDGTFNFADMWYREDQDEPEDEMEPKKTKEAMEQTKCAPRATKKAMKQTMRAPKVTKKSMKRTMSTPKAFSPWRKLMKS